MSAAWLALESGATGSLPFERCTSAPAITGSPGLRVALVAGAYVATYGVLFVAKYAIYDGSLTLHNNGSGVGASHQTGWTGLVAKMIQQHAQHGLQAGQAGRGHADPLRLFPRGVGGMIGGDDADRAVGERRPQRVAVAGGPQRRQHLQP